MFYFFFKQKTAYEIKECDWSSDVCSSDLTKGATDKQGLLTLQVEDKTKKKKPAAQDADEAAEEGDADTEAEGAGEDQTTDSYLVMSTQGDNFAISDLESYYFGGNGDEGDAEEGGGSSDLTSYIYTDRPVYRPEQHVYFKGILRTRTDSGYKIPAGKTVSVSVTDEQGEQVFEQDLPLSTRGTFSADFDLPEESEVGNYTINASVGEESATGSFTVEEYKKPEYKVKVTTPQAFVHAGDKGHFTVSVSYFFG